MTFQQAARRAAMLDRERLEAMLFDVSDLRRITGSMLVYGRFHEENEKGQVRAKVGSMSDYFITPWLDVATDDRGGVDISRSFKDGDVIAIFNPKGDFTFALVLGVVKRKKDDSDLGVTFEDGATVFYRASSKTLEVSLPDGAALSVSVGSEKIEAGSGAITLTCSAGGKLSLGSGFSLTGGGLELLSVLDELVSGLKGPAAVDPNSGQWLPPITQAVAKAKTDIAKLKGA
jgi:phage baseplate assembly protein gpV